MAANNRFANGSRKEEWDEFNRSVAGRHAAAHENE